MRFSLKFRNSRLYIQYQEMNKEQKSFQIVLDRYQEQYKKSEPDLYIILRHKIYPFHKKYLEQSLYIRNMIAANQKVIIIGFEINNLAFQKVVEFLYTYQFMFQRDIQIEQIFQIAKLLQIPRLENALLQDFEINFDEYNIFLMYKLAHLYNLNHLLDKCNEQLINLDYQQININKYNLYGLDQDLFEQIIKNHQKLKMNKTISGLKTKQIQEVIEQYSEYHECSINLQRVLHVDHKDFNIESAEIATPKIKKNMTLSHRKSNGVRQKQKKAIKSCQCINFTGCGDKIKEILIQQMQKPYSQMINTINQISKSGYLGFQAQKLMEISQRGSQCSLADSIQNQGNNSKGYETLKLLSNIGRTDSIQERQINDSDFICINRVKKTIQQESTQANTLISQQSAYKCSAHMLKVPEIPRDLTF